MSLCDSEKADFPCNSCLSRRQLNAYQLEERATLTGTTATQSKKAMVGCKWCKDSAVQGMVSGFVEVIVTVGLQSTQKEEKDVRQLPEKGFFTVFSYFSPQQNRGILV